MHAALFFSLLDAQLYATSILYPSDKPLKKEGIIQLNKKEVKLLLINNIDCDVK